MSKKDHERARIKKDKKRYVLPTHPKPMQEFIPARVPAAEFGICEDALERLNDALVRGCALRGHFVVESQKPCAKGIGATAPVDLVVVIDTSGSMTDEAKALSAAADAAISATTKSCPSDLRVAWFGIEGTWADTKFTQSYRDYLHGLGVPDSDIVCTIGFNGKEDGAAAIMDISDHFDWRPGASRNIFYLGDEALEGGNPQNADDVTAANSAITVAKARNVTVFTYAGTGVQSDTTAEYARVATETGGSAYVAPASNVGGFQTLLEKIICASGDGGCGPVELPPIRPCFELHWGEGPNDNIETDDVELLCITASNPYSNVVFKDLTVLMSIITDSDGHAVPNLPDETPSVMIKPTYIISFGDVPPCDVKKPDEFPRASREWVLISRGAKEGRYRIYIAYCFKVEFTLVDIDQFDIDIVKS